MQILEEMAKPEEHFNRAELLINVGMNSLLLIKHNCL